MSNVSTTSLSFLSDQETSLDLLNNEAIATAIIGVLRKHPEKPVTIGIHGDWGAGKSSVLEMVETGLSSEEGVLCLRFNGWRFQGFEDAKIAFLEGIVSGLLEKRPALKKAAGKVKSVLRRIDWLKVAKRAGGLAVTAFTGLPSPDQIAAVTSGIGNLLADPARLASKENVKVVLEEAQSMLKPSDESRSIPDEVREFHKEFKELLAEAKINQLVVLVDDLDRCLPDTVIETLEAIRLFVFAPRTAFVVAADEEMIEYSVRKHFPDLKEAPGSQPYSRNYLEKLIQIPFRIPTLGEAETRIYVTLLLAGIELGEDDSDFRKLVSEARNLLKRPWVSGFLDSATVKRVLGDKFALVQNAVTLSEQVGPILTSGTKGNPRQIKRFLNAVFLRQQIAYSRGFGDEVRLPILAKLMLAERFLPHVFEKIASAAVSSPRGICAELTTLEASVLASSPKATEQNVSDKRSKGELTGRTTRASKREATNGSELPEWLSTPEVQEWASVPSALSEVDLRPYLFVAKEANDYFGKTSVVAQFAILAERLVGPKLLVQRLEPELSRLSDAEAAQVFELTKGRVIGGDVFDTQPAGIDGLTVLVKTHPVLQSDLLDFLEVLPIERLGPWAVSGWDRVVIDSTCMSRLQALREGWGKSSNEMLAAAAIASLKITKKT